MMTGLRILGGATQTAGHRTPVKNAQGSIGQRLASVVPTLDIEDLPRVSPSKHPPSTTGLCLRRSGTPWGQPQISNLLHSGPAPYRPFHLGYPKGPRTPTSGMAAPRRRRVHADAWKALPAYEAKKLRLNADFLSCAMCPARSDEI